MQIRLIPKPTTQTSPEPALSLPAYPIRVQTRPLRVLDFDIEARPLHWISGDYVSREVTAIAWQWVGEARDPRCVLLLPYRTKAEWQACMTAMLGAFVDVYNQADVVTGHYITGFDLPTLNGALMECRLPLLQHKAAHDTKVGLVKRAGLSVSQEHLAATLGIRDPKERMNQADWRDGNRLTLEGIARTKTRVMSDVRQHIKFRDELLALDYLLPPRMWQSTEPLPVYEP